MSGEPVPVEVCMHCEKRVNGDECGECGNQTKTVWLDSKRRREVERAIEDRRTDDASHYYDSSELTVRELSKLQNSMVDIRDNTVDIKGNVDSIPSNLSLIKDDLDTIIERMHEQDRELNDIKNSTGFHVQDISNLPTNQIQLMITLFLVSVSAFQILSPSQPIITKLSTAGAISFVIPLLIDYIQDKNN